jgi:hypothetical protein
MKTFKWFITEEYESLYLEELNEAVDDATKEGGVSNNTKGVLHELLVGRHLNNGKHLEKHKNENDETPQQAHDRLEKQIHPNDYNRIAANAKSAAAHIKAHIDSTHKGHVMHAVHWTSKPGDTEKVTGHKASQKEDSSDVYVTTKHPKTGKETHHGISLKVSDKSNKNIPASSLGMESGGSKAREHFNSHKTAILKAHPDLSGKNKVERKEILKSNPKMQADIKKRNQDLLHKVAHSHASELQHHLDSGNHEHVVKHIREVLHAHSTPAEEKGHTFIKHTTYQTAKGVQHHTSKPSEDHEHILKDHKNITVKSSGGSVHFYHNGKKFASQAHKFDSQSDPLSSLKSAGRAT